MDKVFVVKNHNTGHTADVCGSLHHLKVMRERLGTPVIAGVNRYYHPTLLLDTPIQHIRHEARPGDSHRVVVTALQPNRMTDTRYRGRLATAARKYVGVMTAAVTLIWTGTDGVTQVRNYPGV